MSGKENMRETVIFDGRTGSVIAIAGEVDVEHVEAQLDAAIERSDERRAEVVAKSHAELEKRFAELLEAVNDLMKGDEEE